MRRRPAWMIWTHVLAEMWKQVLLTTAVLAAVIAFALAVKPLADGKLSAQDALWFMALATIPALQYVLPFAACFGATLAYHRFATDNELTACYAGGISHRSLLMPSLVTGVVLAATVWGLSNYAIPRFFREMARLVSEDATRLITTSIRRGEAVKMGNALVSADVVVEQGPDEESGAFQRLWLSGLMMVRLDKQGNVVSQGSAKQAAVWLKRSAGGTGADGESEKPSTQVIIKPKDFVAVGEFARGGSTSAVTTYTIPNAFSDDPKYLTFTELQRLKTRPQGMDFIDRRMRTLAVRLAQRDTIDSIREALREHGRAEFAGPFREKVVLAASDLRPTRREGKREPNVLNIVPTKRGQPVVVLQTGTEAAPGKPLQQNAASGFIKMSISQDPQRPGVFATILLRDVVTGVVEEDGEAEAPRFADDEGEEVAAKSEVKERPVADLAYADQAETLTRFEKMTVPELVKQADERIKTRALDADVLNGPRWDLANEVSKLNREIMSKEHERHAMALACLVMVVLGGVMAMRLRDALPLAVYAWAFFPAVACMVTISAGQQMTHRHGPGGLFLLYAGVAGLGVFALIEFVKAAKR